MSERVVKANGIDIWTESFGDPTGVPLLLIMGASVQSIFWPTELIQHFVDAGRFVIRFDNRDTGQSTCFDFAKDPYTLDDMARDAIGVLDAYALKSAHVAGLSMGGMITQVMMLHHRSRVKSAVLMMSSPLSGDGGNSETAVADKNEPVLLAASDLPGPDPAWVARATAWSAVVASTREEKIQKRVDSLEMMVPAGQFNELLKRPLAELEYDRAINYDACDNHSFAMATSQPGDRRPLLASVDVPTLVVHGTEDPILPYAHGVALAETIPGAELLTLEGVGHDPAPHCIAEIAARVIKLQDGVS